MIRKKQILTAVLLTVLGFSLAGCKTKTQSADSQSKTETAKSEAVTTKESADGTVSKNALAAAVDSEQPKVNQAELESIDPKLITDDVIVVTPTPADKITEDLSGAAKKAQLVSTPYYTVKLSETYVTDFVTESIVPGDGVRYVLNFYEKNDYEAFGGGFLYSISLYDADYDYTFMPSYSEMGVLTADNGTYYNVVVEYPTDVQFNPENRKLYQAMAEEEANITNSFSPKSGYEFLPGLCDQDGFEVAENNDIPDENTPYYSDEGEVEHPYVMITNSSQDVIYDSDVYWMTPNQLRIAINEIYARHGRRFKDQTLQAWFDAQQWYNGTIEPEDFDDSVLSAVERTNIQVLQHRREVNSR